LTLFDLALEQKFEAQPRFLSNDPLMNETLKDDQVLE